MKVKNNEQIVKMQLNDIFKCNWDIEKDEISVTEKDQSKGKWNNKKKEKTYKKQFFINTMTFLKCRLSSKEYATEIYNKFHEYNIAISNSFLNTNSTHYDLYVDLFDAYIFVDKWNRIKEIIEDYDKVVFNECCDCNKIYKISKGGAIYLFQQENGDISTGKTNMCPYCNSRKVKMIE